MYSLRQILKQEPAAVKAALLAVVAAVVGVKNYHIDSDSLLQVGVALELVLGLFYVRRFSKSNAQADADTQSALTVQKADIATFLLAPPDPEPEAAQKVATAPKKTTARKTTRSKP